MKKGVLACVVLCMIMVAALTSAVAQELMPYADTEFDSASTVLKSSKQVSFRCVTYETKNSLSVTACWLEKKNTNGSWSYVRSLTPPSTVLTNTFAYSATADYSAYIGSGTYRVWATYNADGHTISRCSNERTF